MNLNDPTLLWGFKLFARDTVHGSYVAIDSVAGADTTQMVIDAPLGWRQLYIVAVDTLGNMSAPSNVVQLSEYVVPYCPVLPP
jgi:protein-disulfide isomerase